MINSRLRILAPVVLSIFLAGLSSSAEKKKLSRSDKRWLEVEVAALITAEEARIFRELSSKKDRNLFKELFWIRRDPNLFTPQNEFKEDFEKRVETADRWFREAGRRGSTTDRGKIYMLLGVPNQSGRNPRQASKDPFNLPPGAPTVGSGSSSTGSAFPGPDESDIVPVSTVQRPLAGLQWSNWEYEPNPERNIPGGLTIELQSQAAMGNYIIRTKELDAALELVKKSYIIHRDIDYTRDRNGRLMNLPPKFDPRSPAKKVLREMMETKKETPDIPFESRVAFFQSSDDNYVPLLFEIDSEPLKWSSNFASVTLFGVVETMEAQPILHFEEPVRLNRSESSSTTFEMPLQLPPGNYTFNLGILEDRTDKVGTRRVRVFVPSFPQGELVMSSVLLYGDRRQVEAEPGTPGHAFQFGQVHFKPKGSRPYRPKDNLGIFFFVYGFGLDEQGQPNLSGDYEVFVGEKQQTRIEAQALDANPSRAVAALEFPLADFEPGSYRLEIQVTDHVTRSIITDRVEFAVEAEPFPLVDYSRLVEGYRKGGFAEFAQMLSRVSRHSLRGATESYWKRPLSEDDLKAAALLHTDVAVLTGQADVFHLEVAQECLNRIEESTRRRSSMRRWYLAVAQHLGASMRSWGAFPILEDALESFPEDEEIRLAVAKVYEIAGWMGVEGMLDRAETLYREILKVSPHHAEAHLRLGRVLQLGGFEDEAVQELLLSLEHTNDPEIEFVTHVLLGNLYSQRSEHSKAAQFYRAALEIDPHCQAAAIALSHSLHRVGDGAGSRQVIDAFFNRKRESSGESNRWWRYVRGDASRVASTLSAMREEVRR